MEDSDRSDSAKKTEREHLLDEERAQPGYGAAAPDTAAQSGLAYVSIETGISDAASNELMLRPHSGQFFSALFGLLMLEFGIPAAAGSVAWFAHASESAGKMLVFSNAEMCSMVWVCVALLCALFLVGRRRALNRILIVAFTLTMAYVCASGMILYGAQFLPVVVFCIMSSALFAIATMIGLLLWMQMKWLSTLLVIGVCLCVPLGVGVAAETGAGWVVLGIVLGTLWFMYVVFDARLISRHRSSSDDVWYACAMLHSDLFKLVFRI